MCIGRRLAEQNIYLVLAKILQHYRIEYVGDKSKFFKLLNTIDTTPYVKADRSESSQLFLERSWENHLNV